VNESPLSAPALAALRSASTKRSRPGYDDCDYGKHVLLLECKHKVTKVRHREMCKRTKRARLNLSTGAVCWERDAEVECAEPAGVQCLVCSI
jgi:hypothetical protein